jgi:hypothetical protein
LLRRNKAESRKFANLLTGDAIKLQICKFGLAQVLRAALHGQFVKWV